jgi:hypothetical protein
MQRAFIAFLRRVTVAAGRSGCLLHDIGYMRGVSGDDTETEFVVDGIGKKITLHRGESDAAFAPYHVDHSKLFAFGQANFDVLRLPLPGLAE